MGDGRIVVGTLNVRQLLLNKMSEVFNNKIEQVINEPFIKKDNRLSNTDNYRKFVRNHKGAKK